MKIRNRFLALAALLGASSLALTGCVIPFGGGDDQTDETQTDTQVDETQTEDTQTEDTQTDDADFDVTGTEWEGDIGGDAVELLLNADGTVDFIYFEGIGELDHPDDTWSVSGNQLTLSLVYGDDANPEIIDFTGDINPDTIRLSSNVGMSATLNRM